MRKILTSIFSSLAIAALVPAVALAHVIVTPSQVGIGQELTFNVSVPNEQQTPVSTVRLVIPNGVTNVMPTVKNGWTITTKTNGNAKDPEVTEITWSGGTVPVGQRDDFSFSAQVPASATDVNWKAFQTYADGTVVYWDQKPAGSDDSTGNAGPYSVTHIVNDLTKSTTAAATSSSNSNGSTALVFSIVALALSVLAFMTTRKKASKTGNTEK